MVLVWRDNEALCEAGRYAVFSTNGCNVWVTRLWLTDEAYQPIGYEPTEARARSMAEKHYLQNGAR